MAIKNKGYIDTVNLLEPVGSRASIYSQLLWKYSYERMQKNSHATHERSLVEGDAILRIKQA